MTSFHRKTLTCFLEDTTLHFQGFATTHKKAQTAQEYTHLADTTRTPGKGRAGRARAQQDGASGPFCCQVAWVPVPTRSLGSLQGLQAPEPRAALCASPRGFGESCLDLAGGISAAGPQRDVGSGKPQPHTNPTRPRDAPCSHGSAHSQLSGSLARQTSSPPSTTPDRKGILFFKQLLFLSFSCQLKFRSLTTGGKRYYCLEARPERLGAELPPASAPVAQPRCHLVSAVCKPGSGSSSWAKGAGGVWGNMQPPDKKTCNNSQRLFYQKINIPLALH